MTTEVNEALFVRETNLRLDEFLKNNSFIFIKSTCWASRRKVELLWESPGYFMKIYFDPQGGEINCLYAKGTSQNPEEDSPQWRYINELLLDTRESYERELIHNSAMVKRRSFSEQLDHIVKSLNENFATIKNGLERASWID
jgi:hypothetical protein